MVGVGVDVRTVEVIIEVNLHTWHTYWSYKVLRKLYEKYSSVVYSTAQIQKGQKAVCAAEIVTMLHVGSYIELGLFETDVKFGFYKVDNICRLGTYLSWFR